jgi:hypothetical protein
VRRFSWIACLLALLGCKDPPEAVPVPAPAPNEGETKAITEAAHREALTRALPSVRSLLMTADPLAAWQIGLGPALSPPLTIADRRALDARLGPIDAEVGEIQESSLSAAEVVILRAIRFGLGRLNDDLHRRSGMGEDPSVALERIAANLAELRYRLLHDDCDATCSALPEALAERVGGLGRTLVASSRETAAFAQTRTTELAEQARTLAGNPLLAERAELRTGLEALATALDAHAQWLAELGPKFDTAPTQAWAAPQIERREVSEPVVRLPAILGADALIRRFSAEERIDLQPGPAFAEIERMVRRWEVMRTELVGDATLPKPADVDVGRCEAALARLTTGLARVEEVEAPKLDCSRYVALFGTRPIDEGELVLDLLDYGVIEPQRRKLRAAELPEIAMISGQWSTRVHTHLRRVMLLARLSEPAATLHALNQGRRALCWAEAALWIHAQLGPAQEVALTVGGPCAELGDADTIAATVSADPRGALAGFGLSLIGDEPARMVGFDSFFWAPLGTMRLLATPPGMHPDEFRFPDEPEPTPTPPPNVKFERL